MLPTQTISGKRWVADGKNKYRSKTERNQCIREPGWMISQSFHVRVDIEALQGPPKDKLQAAPKRNDRPLPMPRLFETKRRYALTVVWVGRNDSSRCTTQSIYSSPETFEGPR